MDWPTLFQFVGRFGWMAAAMIYLVIKLLTRHQQRMTELIHGSKPDTLSEVGELRKEVAELRRLVTQQSLIVNDLSMRQIEGVSPSPLVQKVGMGGERELNSG